MLYSISFCRKKSESSATFGRKERGRKNVDDDGDWRMWGGVGSIRAFLLMKIALEEKRAKGKNLNYYSGWRSLWEILVDF